MTLAQRFRPLRTRLMVILAVVGPGIITANVDNDAGGITTYSVAGAHYGYSLLWMMPLVAIALIVVQEMSARLGVVTGKGLADLIREVDGRADNSAHHRHRADCQPGQYGQRVCRRRGQHGDIWHQQICSRCPLAAMVVWLLIVKGSYGPVEKIFLIASAIYLAYVASGVMAHPDWGTVTRAVVTPTFHFEAGYVTIFVTIIGTTIAPWMQFYQQASIVDKGIKLADYAYERLDVIIGSLFAVLVAAFHHGCLRRDAVRVTVLRIDTAQEAAAALRPLAGTYASTLFALGLLNASVFSAAILPLSTAYVVCEAFGWELGVDRSLREAPAFFTIYTLLIVLGAGIILLPIKSLIQAMLASQTLNGVLLPVVLIVMLRLINDKRWMGKYVNGPTFNAVAWSIVGVLILLTVILILVSVFPGLLG